MKTKKALIPLTITSIILLLDLSSKFIISNIIKLNNSLILIQNTIHLTHVKNTGAAFSLFQNKSLMLILIGILATAYIIYMLLTNKNKKTNIYLSIILGGILGNTLERIFFNQVTDFIDVLIWPIFNIADIAITIGTALLIIQLVKEEIDDRLKIKNKSNSKNTNHKIKNKIKNY